MRASSGQVCSRLTKVSGHPCPIASPITPSEFSPDVNTTTAPKILIKRRTLRNSPRSEIEDFFARLERGMLRQYGDASINFRMGGCVQAGYWDAAPARAAGGAVVRGRYGTRPRRDTERRRGARSGGCARAHD